MPARPDEKVRPLAKERAEMKLGTESTVRTPVAGG
jgi:hypothetical protein